MAIFVVRCFHPSAPVAENYFKTLQVDEALKIVRPSLMRRTESEAMVEYWMERGDCPAVSFMTPCLGTLMASGRSSGCMVHVGDSSIEVGTFYESYLINEFRSNLGMHDVAKQLAKTLGVSTEVAYALGCPDVSKSMHPIRSGALNVAPYNIVDADFVSRLASEVFSGRPEDPEKIALPDGVLVMSLPVDCSSQHVTTQVG